MHTLVEVDFGDPTDPDLIADGLWAAGAVGVEELATVVVGAFTDDEAASVAAGALGGRLRRVDDTKGLDAWREHADVVNAGPFSLRPPWLDPGPGQDLVIDPGHTFGSGSHPSTRLALRLLAPRISPGTSVVDLGAGSGVLAIAAAVLGARAIAIDHDPASADTIAENAARNGVADLVEVRIGDLFHVDTVADLTADIALLNVTVDIHERVAPVLHERRIGSLIVAGILAGPQEKRCESAHRRIASEQIAEGEWAALVLDHGPATDGS